MNYKRYSISAAAVLLGILYAFLLGASPSGQSERVIALPELEEPSQIVVEGGRAYFADSRDVIVFDLRDGRLLRRIGRLG